MTSKIINFHGTEVEVHGKDEHDSIRHLVHSWENSASAFEDMRHALKEDNNHKMYVGDKGNIVFQKNEEGKYVLRKSTSR